MPQVGPVTVGLIFGEKGNTIVGRDGEDAEQPLLIPGIQGPQGNPGKDAYIIPGKDGEDGENPVPIPGLPGTPGTQGIQGIQGLQGIGIQGEDGEDGQLAPPIMTGFIYTSTIPFVIDGAGAVITTGLKGGVPVDFSATILGWTLLSTDGTSGAMVIDIWKAAYSGFPPTVANTITASAKPNIAATNAKNTSTTLTGWTTTIIDGDVIYFNVDSVTSLKRVVIGLRISRTI